MPLSSLLTRLRRFFSAGIAGESEGETAAIIAQSLKDTSELFQKQLTKTKVLRAELQYLYHIFLRRNKCNYRLEFAAGPHFLLFTTERDASGINIMVYAPREQAEIAELYVCASDSELVIDSIKLQLLYCGPRFGELLLQELVAEARARGLRRITGAFSRAKQDDFEGMAGFYRQAGFEVSTGEDTGSIAYEIEA